MLVCDPHWVTVLEIFGWIFDNLGRKEIDLTLCLVLGCCWWRS